MRAGGEAIEEQRAAMTRLETEAHEQLDVSETQLMDPDVNYACFSWKLLALLPPGREVSHSKCDD